MSERHPTILLSAAERSGDTHAANLVRALRRRVPGARFIGIGGQAMAAAGVELLADTAAQASMGLGPVGKLGYYRRVLRQVEGAIDEAKPDVVVPVDSPALNWHVAAAARRRHRPVLYYVCPQVWAWAPWRIRKLRRNVDHVACLLPFEPDYLRQRGVPATFVGHPLLDHVPPRPDTPPEPPADGAWRVVLLPGSRQAEIERHAAGFAEAARRIRQQYPNARCSFAPTDERSAEHIRRLAGQEFPIVIGQAHAEMAASHLALAVSGTVTLETAYFGLPMVVVYRTGRLAWALARTFLLRTPYLSLVNILAGRELVPELMPWHGDPSAIAAAALGLLADPAGLARLRADLIALTDPLKDPQGRPPSEAVAELVLATLGQGPAGPL